MAGHSLGEYAALVCAEAFDFETAVQLVAHRGHYMQASVAAGQGAMAAIVGLQEDEVNVLCQEAAEQETLSPANYNSIGQIVAAGQTNGVDRAIRLAKAKGAKIAKLIPVSVPSHCALMQPAAERLAKDLQNIRIRIPKIPVIQNKDVTAHHDPEKIRSALVDQLVHPVRWVETIQSMANQNIHLFIEAGPSKVLAGLNKRIVQPGETLSVHSKESILAAISAIK